MNKFGHRFTFSTFGESHGKAIGCVIDGLPAGLKIDEDYIQNELNRRKPGQNKFATSRVENDKVEILSGVFDGFSTGTSLAMVIYNENQKSGDYENVKDLFRPSHADFTYFHKYAIRDYRGGGRSSARETAARVAVGAIAKLLLNEIGIKIQSGICSIAGHKAKDYDFEYAKTSEIFALDKNIEAEQKRAILNAKEKHDSVGGVVLIKALNVPVGLGEPMYCKLDGQIANAMMGINAVKAVEIGNGVESSSLLGSQNNDQITKNGFSSNNSGGILGGISNGEEIVVKIHFKPTPSIFQKQQTVNKLNEEVQCELKGRHDPCVAIRGSVVAEAMLAIVLCDMLLLNMSSKIENIKKVYK